MQRSELPGSFSTNRSNGPSLTSTPIQGTTPSSSLSDQNDTSPMSVTLTTLTSCNESPLSSAVLSDVNCMFVPISPEALTRYNNRIVMYLHLVRKFVTT